MFAFLACWTRHRIDVQEATPVGQKTVRFSDLSGELITRDDTLARIVIHEHPELGDIPVEIEALADEAARPREGGAPGRRGRALPPGRGRARRVAMEAAAFDEMAADKPMSELPPTARPRGRPGGPPRQGGRAPGHRLRHPGARWRAAQGPDHRSRARAGPGPPGLRLRAVRRPGPAGHRPRRPEHASRDGLDDLAVARAAQGDGARGAAAGPAPAPAGRAAVVPGRPADPVSYAGPA